MVHGEQRLSPWLDPADVRRRGIVLVWQSDAPDRLPKNLQLAFPNAQLQPPLILPRQGILVRGSEIIGYALVLPQP
jgi:hypothetical protein